MILIPKLTLLRPHGAILADGHEVADLLQCGHCQYTWQVQPGSGRRRGFCYRCMRVTCNRPEKPECQIECTPFDADG